MLRDVSWLHADFRPGCVGRRGAGCTSSSHANWQDAEDGGHMVSTVSLLMHGPDGMTFIISLVTIVICIIIIMRYVHHFHPLLFTWSHAEDVCKLVSCPFSADLSCLQCLC